MAAIRPSAQMRKPGEFFVYKGSTYVSAAETKGCEGCSFFSKTGGCRVVDAHPNCGGVIFKLAQGGLPSISDQVVGLDLSGPSKAEWIAARKRPLDFSKPVQTRDGQKVRVLCTDSEGPWPVVVLVGEGAQQELVQYSLNGKRPMGCFAEKHPLDLINPPVVTKMETDAEIKLAARALRCQMRGLARVRLNDELGLWPKRKDRHERTTRLLARVHGYCRRGMRIDVDAGST